MTGKLFVCLQKHLSSFNAPMWSSKGSILVPSPFLPNIDRCGLAPDCEATGGNIVDMGTVASLY